MIGLLIFVIIIIVGVSLDYFSKVAQIKKKEKNENSWVRAEI